MIGVFGYFFFAFPVSRFSSDLSLRSTFFTFLTGWKLFRNNTSLQEHVSYGGIVVYVFFPDFLLSVQVLLLYVDRGHFCREVFGFNTDCRQKSRPMDGFLVLLISF